MNEHSQSVEQQRQSLLPGYIKRWRRGHGPLTDVLLTTEIITLRFAENFFRVTHASRAWIAKQTGRITSELIHPINSDALWSSTVTHKNGCGICMKPEPRLGLMQFVAWRKSGWGDPADGALPTLASYGPGEATSESVGLRHVRDTSAGAGLAFAVPEISLGKARERNRSKSRTAQACPQAGCSNRRSGREAEYRRQ